MGNTVNFCKVVLHIANGLFFATLPLWANYISFLNFVQLTCHTIYFSGSDYGLIIV